LFLYYIINHVKGISKAHLGKGIRIWPTALNPMLELIRNTLKFLRHHGWPEFFIRIWRQVTKSFYENRSVYIFKLPPQIMAKPDQNIEVTELTRDDTDKMQEIMYVSRAGLQERFLRGDRCFAVLEKGNILSFMWIRFGERYVCELRLKFNLKPNQGWFYNALTVKSVRGMGYYTNIYRYMTKVLVAEGFDELLLDVEERNRASIHGIEKAGYKQVVKIQMKKLLSKVVYKVTVFDKNAWQRLAEIIDNFGSIGWVIEDKP
jgi:hypothetical protein